MTGATDCLTAVCKDLKDSGTKSEDLLMAVEAVSDAIRTSFGEMAVAGLTGGEIEQVLASSMVYLPALWQRQNRRTYYNILQ